MHGVGRGAVPDHRGVRERVIHALLPGKGEAEGPGMNASLAARPFRHAVMPCRATAPSGKACQPCSLSAMSFMNRASSPAASQCASAAIAPSMSLSGSISALA